MSGILDSKSRIIDAFVTTEGRRQLAQGEMRISYVSFSDASAFYEPDVASGSSDASVRLYLESSNLPQDQVIFEADDSGRLLPFKGHVGLAQLSGQLLARSLNVTSSIVAGSRLSAWTSLSGSTFASQIDGLITGSIDNFTNIRIIGSFDELFGEQSFAVGPDSATFIITDRGPIDAAMNTVCDVNSLESLFSDPRLSVVRNFQHLPPVNADDGIVIGRYPPWGATLGSGAAIDSLRRELRSFADMGFRRDFVIDPTSISNSLACQFFEMSHDRAVKMDVLQFGSFADPDAVNGSIDVFFVGKVKVDDMGAQSFVHIFTLIFE